MDQRDWTSMADEALVDAWIRDPEGRAGRAAVECLFARWSERIYRWCFRFTHDHDRALDLAQESQLQAFRSLGSFAGRSEFSSWLFSVVRFTCLHSVRRQRLPIDEDADPDAMAGETAAIEDHLDEERALQLVKEVLNPDEQLALWMRCWEGLPVDEITAVLGLSGSSGARGLLQNARRKLRAALEARRHEGSHN